MIYIFLLSLLSFFVSNHFYFKRKNILSKIILFVCIFAFWLFVVLVIFVYLWNSTPDYRQQRKMEKSWDLQILNDSNQPLKNAKIIELGKYNDTIISDNEGYVNVYNINSDSLIIKVKGYIIDTISVNKLESNKIYLSKISKE